MRRARSLLITACIALAGCSEHTPAQHLDLDAIRIAGDAKLRTDTVGGGRFTDTASFVLIDAENTAGEGAYVTLGGALVETGGREVGALRPQSLWIPPGEARTFALVDMDRKPRSAATSARIDVRGALRTSPPRARIDELTRFDDHGKVVVQAWLVNDSDRIATVMAVGAFHDARDRPMTRPFTMYELPPRGRKVVQFVGPEGSVRGTIFVGDATF